MKKLLLLSLVALAALAGCADEYYMEGRITTAAAADVTPQSAVLSGKIEVVTSGGGKLEVADRGFVFGEKPDNLNRTVSNSAGGSGTFSCTAEGLMPNTKYYARAYAGIGHEDWKDTVSDNTKRFYGNSINFTTPDGQAAPYVSTQAASSIAYGSATLNGTIISTGLPAAAEYGFVYGKTPSPTVMNGTKKTASGSSAVGAYNLAVTGIDADVTYYARAYAANVKGTAYGDEVSFKFTSVKPALTVEQVTNQNVAAGTATFNGTITNVGDPAYTERGFVYGTTVNATITNSTKVAVSGTGAGSYSANVTKIPVTGTSLTYYVRAYAISATDTAYSSGAAQLSFGGAFPSFYSGNATISNVNRAAGSATFSHSGFSNVGVPAYTEKGFLYHTSSDGTVMLNSGTRVVVTGSGSGSFSATVTGLPLTTYYVRAYAINAVGATLTNYATLDLTPVAPTLGTTSISNKNITAGTVTFNGSISNAGDPAYTEKGFVYGTATNPTTTNGTKVIVSGTGTGSYTANVSGLAQGTVYYMRAFVYSAGTYHYSSNVTVDFTPVTPMLGTASISNKNITAGTVTFNGSITDVGDPAYTEKGFVYGTATNPTTTNGTKVIVSGTGTGSYTANASGFAQGTVYYMRAYATSSTGTYYSSNVTVSFVLTAPTVTTGAVTMLSATSATFSGNITNAGEPAYTEKGFVYSTSQNPTTANTKNIVQGSGTGAYSATITGLTNGASYYVRAYAINSVETVYGTSVGFTATAPTDYVELVQANIAVQKTDISVGTDWSSASTLCSNSRVGGFSNWRLPTIGELSVLYTYRTTIGGFSTTSSTDSRYWSSSSAGSTYYYYYNFYLGSQNYADRSSTYRVRCVRTLQ